MPVCTGHGYQGFPVIATMPAMFDELTYLDGQKYEFAEGRNFDTEDYFEAVVGARGRQEDGPQGRRRVQPDGLAGQGRRSRPRG